MPPGSAVPDGPSLLVVEAGISLIAVAVALCWPGVGAVWLSRV